MRMGLLDLLFSLFKRSLIQLIRKGREKFHDMENDCVSW